jgi:hypothetical protein
MSYDRGIMGQRIANLPISITDIRKQIFASRSSVFRGSEFACFLIRPMTATPAKVLVLTMLTLGV